MLASVLFLMQVEARRVQRHVTEIVEHGRMSPPPSARCEPDVWRSQWADERSSSSARSVNSGPRARNQCAALPNTLLIASCVAERGMQRPFLKNGMTGGVSSVRPGSGPARRLSRATQGRSAPVRPCRGCQATAASVCRRPADARRCPRSWRRPRRGACPAGRRGH